MNRPPISISIPELDRKARSTGGSEGAVQHLHQIDVAHRWHLSVRTLERWRWQKRGPRYVKVGGRVLYRMEDIEEFERANLKPGIPTGDD